MRLLRQHAFLRETFCRAHVQGPLRLSYTMGKRKRSTVAESVVEASIPLPPPIAVLPQKSTRSRSSTKEDAPATNDVEPQITVMNGAIISRITKQEDSDSPLSDSFDIQSCEEETTIAKRNGEATETSKRSAIESLTDQEAECQEIIDEEEVQEALSRPPPVNSDYLPMPWKGRLGYVRYRRQHTIEQVRFD